jgi:ribonucleoside-triphosphate reductase
MDIAARSLKIKRGVITKLLDEGLYPYTKRYLGTFENHFSTIGLIGMNEVGLNANWLRADLTHKETQEFTKEVLVPHERPPEGLSGTVRRSVQS